MQIGVVAIEKWNSFDLWNYVEHFLLIILSGFVDYSARCCV